MQWEAVRYWEGCQALAEQARRTKSGEPPSHPVLTVPSSVVKAQCVVFKPAVLNGGPFGPPRGHSQTLETFLVVTTGGGEALGIKKVGPTDAAQHPTRHGTGSAWRTICRQMSAVLRNWDTNFKSTLAESPCLREVWNLRPALLEKKGD